MIKTYAVPPQRGRVAVVTGTTSGIGLWTAAGLAKAGAHVILVCRNWERGEKAKAFVTTGSAGTADLLLADFADLNAVRGGAAEIADRYPEVHILVNNAGVFSRKRELTKDGYEMTFAVNHLAPFLFTNTLLPTLERAGKPGQTARVVTVASNAAQRASIDMQDLMLSQRYSMFGAYSQSKLANILFTKELARRLPPRPITANCLHPGVVATRLGNKGGIAGLVWTAIKPFIITPEQGALNSLYVATSPEIEGVSGAFFVDQRQGRVNPIAEDPAIASGLWSQSEALVETALQGNRTAA
ncbi:MAG: SDR family oxidoreductase [Rhodomicrobium sp.]